MQRSSTNTMLKTGILFQGSSAKSYEKRLLKLGYNHSSFPHRRCLKEKNFKKGRGTSLQGGSFYFRFHQKWSKLGTILQTGSNEAETKKNCKFMTVRPVIGPSFDF
jgi:hypothetical protein